MIRMEYCPDCDGAGLGCPNCEGGLVKRGSSITPKIQRAIEAEEASTYRISFYGSRGKETYRFPRGEVVVVKSGDLSPELENDLATGGKWPLVIEELGDQVMVNGIVKDINDNGWCVIVDIGPADVCEMQHIWSTHCRRCTMKECSGCGYESIRMAWEAGHIPGPTGSECTCKEHPSGCNVQSGATGLCGYFAQ